MSKLNDGLYFIDVHLRTGGNDEQKEVMEKIYGHNREGF